MKSAQEDKNLLAVNLAARVAAPVSYLEMPKRKWFRKKNKALPKLAKGEPRVCLFELMAGETINGSALNSYYPNVTDILGLTCDGLVTGEAVKRGLMYREEYNLHALIALPRPL